MVCDCKVLGSFRVLKTEKITLCSSLDPFETIFFSFRFFLVLEDQTKVGSSQTPHKMGSPMLVAEGQQYILKKNQNAPRPSEHHPVRGGKVSKRLVGGIKGCKYKTSPWHLNGFPDGNNIVGSTV